MIRFDAKWVLTLLFVALGPLGNVLTPSLLPPPFRTYYFILPLFPLFYFQIRHRFATFASLFLPFLLYCFVSANLLALFGEANEPQTIFRFFLLLCQFFFVVGASGHIKNESQMIGILKTYLLFYFVSLSIGYLFFLGYYLELLPLSLLEKFTVLTQFGFGLLRFSPGSYPNEYGVVSSFVLSILLLILIDKKTFAKKWLYLLIPATFIALLLTTTRAAYLSFCMSMLYITWKSEHFLRNIFLVTSLIVLIFSLLLLVDINMFQILASGFTQRFSKGSLGERYFIWSNSIAKSQDHLFFGAGFASLTNVHNVYLQLFFELGLVGLALLLVSLLLAFFGRRKKEALNDPFFRKIRMIGLINVLSFAASNHNINHHLTWFVCFLWLVSLKLQTHKNLSIPFTSHP